MPSQQEADQLVAAARHEIRLRDAKIDQLTEALRNIAKLDGRHDLRDAQIMAEAVILRAVT